MRSTPHILVINGTKVRRPVFVLGAPHSGAELLARAVKRSAGFHLTTGRPGVLRVAYAFARQPSIASDRERGAARVLRDAYAEAWQISERACAACPAECRELAGLPPAPAAPGGAGAGPAGGGQCVDAHQVLRFADASTDLIYSADVLLDAFPDAQLLQVIRDGRDVVADMLGDPRCLAWFKPGLANLDRVFPNPFFGVEELAERDRWTRSATAVKCALRWRGSVRLSARLRRQTPEDQLFTVRYEDLVAKPRRVAGEVSDYLGAPISRSTLSGLVRTGRAGRHEADEHGVGAWRERLSPRQVAQVEKVAGIELGRLGYPLSAAG
ncbi:MULTISPECIES: sulfotransferase family protein [Thermomonosporaceae]|uniref:sulfotransferase family protein n=1 Tax=Thermomonosporaceae TaxID=2012 RepID=UPI00255AD951|nr:MULTISPECIES: sulfotransferase [Thermomonosporaceae]MDL4777111.1 sulfotransferase [Actinomadura xylanilytica]